MLALGAEHICWAHTFAKEGLTWLCSAGTAPLDAMLNQVVVPGWTHVCGLRLFCG